MSSRSRKTAKSRKRSSSKRAKDDVTRAAKAIDGTRIERPVTSRPNPGIAFWNGSWLTSAFAVAAATIAVVVVTWGDFVSYAIKLGVPFLILIVTIAGVVAARKQLIGSSFQWPQAILTVSLVASVVTGAVIAGLTLREDSRAQVSAQLAGGQAGLNWTMAEVSGLTYLSKDLRGTSAQGASLLDIDFQNSDLSSSDFRGARMDRVNFSGATLCAVDFRGADLRGALNLEEAENMDFLLYDEKTKFPEEYDISVIRGPLNTKRQTLLYSCAPGTTQLMDLMGEETP